MSPPVSGPNGTFLSVRDGHSHSTSRPPPPPKPCTPGVRGGSAVPVPAGHTHTHRHTHTHTHRHTQYTGWQTKPLAVPKKTSHASELSLSSSLPVVRGRHRTRCCRLISKTNGYIISGGGRVGLGSVEYFPVFCCWGVEMLAERRENSR